MNQHLSEDQFCRAVAGQSTADEQRHVDACPACRVELDRFVATLGAFRGAVTAWAESHVPCDAHGLESRRSVAPLWRQTLAAGAVVSVIAAAALMPREPSTGSAPDDVSGSPAEEASEFFPLAYSTVPATDGRIVRLEVPVDVLAAFGLDAVDSTHRPLDAVLADVVVGEDGLARAVRFVRPLRKDTVQKERQP